MPSYSHAELDRLVTLGLADEPPESIRSMATALGVDRGRIARSVARIRRQAAQPAPGAVPAPSSELAALADRIDRRQARAQAAADGPELSLGARLRAEFEVALSANNLDALERLSRILKRLPGSEQAEPDPLDAGPQWSALDEKHMSCLGYLCGVAAGESPEGDPEHEWWAELFAAIPERPQVVHPAHVPLPSGAPGGPAFYVPGAASDPDPVAREVRRLNGRAP